MQLSGGIRIIAPDSAKESLTITVEFGDYVHEERENQVRYCA
jgi:hypothetical protein